MQDLIWRHQIKLDVVPTFIYKEVGVAVPKESHKLEMGIRLSSSNEVKEQKSVIQSKSF